MPRECVRPGAGTRAYDGVRKRRPQTPRHAAKRGRVVVREDPDPASLECLKNREPVDGADDRRVGIAGRTIDEKCERNAAVMNGRHVTRQRRDVGKMTALRTHAPERGRKIVVFERYLATAERQEVVECALVIGEKTRQRDRGDAILRRKAATVEELKTGHRDAL